MKKIKTHRMEDGSMYRIMEDKSVYMLEFYDLQGKMEVVTKGELSLVEEVFNQKTHASVSAPSVTLTVEPEVVAAGNDPVEFDCPKDPCAFPDCDCDPVVAPTEPQPFGE